MAARSISTKEILMKLFYSPGACSLAPHIILREAAAIFTLEKVDTATHTVAATGKDFYAINPRGQVPLLQLEDGTTLTEGPIIAQYIADQSANRSLLPAAGSMLRYQIMSWQNYVTSELHKSYTPLFNPQFDETAKRLHAEILRKKYVWLDEVLADKTYLTGDDFTVADAYLFTVTTWSKYVNLALADLPNLQTYMARITARPLVKEAMRIEGLIN
jgi:glutathione S-transferase